LSIEKKIAHGFSPVKELTEAEKAELAEKVAKEKADYAAKQAEIDRKSVEQTKTLNDAIKELEDSMESLMQEMFEDFPIEDMLDIIKDMEQAIKDFNTQTEGLMWTPNEFRAVVRKKANKMLKKQKKC
jgi:ribonuclease HII